MKKEYESPKLEVIELHFDDVITASMGGSKAGDRTIDWTGEFIKK